MSAPSRTNAMATARPIAVRDAMRFFILVIVGLLAACAGPKLPAPNSADVRYDGRDRAVPRSAAWS